MAEGGAIPGGRWLCPDLQGNVTGDTPAGLADDFYLRVNATLAQFDEFVD